MKNEDRIVATREIRLETGKVISEGNLGVVILVSEYIGEVLVKFDNISNECWVNLDGVKQA